MSAISPEPGSTPPDPAEDGPQGAARLASARKKLRAALEGLEFALNARAERAREQEDQSAEFSAMQEDRSRLAQELEAATGRLRALEAARDEVLLRVERASAAVRAVLASDDARQETIAAPAGDLADNFAVADGLAEPPADAEANGIEPPELAADAETAPDSQFGES